MNNNTHPLPKLKLKSCPKCSGDLTLQHDPLGQYYECLQCGWEKEVSDNDCQDNLPIQTP